MLNHFWILPRPVEGNRWQFKVVRKRVDGGRFRPSPRMILAPLKFDLNGASLVETDGLMSEDSIGLTEETVHPRDVIGAVVTPGGRMVVQSHAPSAFYLRAFLRPNAGSDLEAAVRVNVPAARSVSLLGLAENDDRFITSLVLIEAAGDLGGDLKPYTPEYLRSIAQSLTRRASDLSERALALALLRLKDERAYEDFVSKHNLVSRIDHTIMEFNARAHIEIME